MAIIKICILIYAAFLSMVSVQAFSLPQDDMKLVGQAQLKYLIWNVYKANIYSLNSNFSYEDGDSFVLEIIYQKNITKNLLLNETIKQWQAIGVNDQEKIKSWLNQLNNILIDVKKGDSISLFIDESYRSHFYLNQVLLGQVKDPGFSRSFSAIWLSKNTTKPQFREELLRNLL